MIQSFNGYLVLLSVILLQPVEAQSPKAGGPRNATADQRQPIEDSLGRGTPQGAVVGLIRAAEEGNLARAAEYLVSKLEPPDRRELARKLSVVLDRKLLTTLGSLSNKPDGDLGDGPRTSRYHAGIIESPSGDVEILLDRVQRGNDTPIWLFSSESLQEIPRLYDEVRPQWIEAYVPARLRTARWLSIPLYRWIAILIFIPVVFGFAALSTRVLTVLLRPLLRRLTREQDDHKLATIVAPLRLQVLALFFYGASLFGVTFIARRFWDRVAVTLTVTALCWLLLRLMDVVAALILKRSQRLNRSGDTALVRLVHRLSKAAAVIVAGLVLLFLAGVDLTAVLTGLGLGGLAIGFGAQKTIENLFGGVMVISDQPVNVGDVCRIGEFLGTVEDIGLRSTRIRTADRTVVSIPNGHLANMSLENFALRDRIRFHHTVGLRSQTTVDQVRSVLTGIRRLLDVHPKVESASARTRFVRFSGWSLDLEISAYVLERDQQTFLAIQEDLLLGIMDVMDTSGTSLALPLRTAYVAENRDLDDTGGRVVSTAKQ
jgi:MscS family membrane protein